MPRSYLSMENLLKCFLWIFPLWLEILSGFFFLRITVSYCVSPSAACANASLPVWRWKPEGPTSRSPEAQCHHAGCLQPAAVEGDGITQWCDSFSKLLPLHYGNCWQSLKIQPITKWVGNCGWGAGLSTCASVSMPFNFFLIIFLISLFQISHLLNLWEGTSDLGSEGHLIQYYRKFCSCLLLVQIWRCGACA